MSHFSCSYGYQFDLSNFILIGRKTFLLELHKLLYKKVKRFSLDKANRYIQYFYTELLFNCSGGFL